MSLQISKTQISLILIIYLAIVRILRYRRLAQIKRLYRQICDHWDDPSLEPVFEELYMCGGKYEFPLMTETAFSYGLFKTYGIPSISRLLAKTKKFETTPLKRYDDTDIIMREILENPLVSTRSQTAVRRLNFIHGQYRISNDDMLYTLSVFCCEPYIWISRNKCEWRDACKEELDVAYHYWRRVGIELGIHSIPGSFEDMLRFHDEYEEDRMVYAETNHEVAEITVKLFQSQLPSFLRPLGRKMIISIMNERLRTAMGYEEISPLYRKLLMATLRLRGFIIRHFFLPRIFYRRRTSENFNAKGLLTLKFHTFAPVYKDGYRTEDLGAVSSTKGLLGEVKVLQENSVLQLEKKVTV